MDAIEKMKSGELYGSADESLLSKQMLCLEKLYDYNATRPSEFKKRETLLKSMFAR